MATRLPGDASSGFRSTDHSKEIARLLSVAASETDRDDMISVRLAAELLQAHDDTGVSLADWPTALQFVESHLGHPVLPNLT